LLKALEDHDKVHIVLEMAKVVKNLAFGDDNKKAFKNAGAYEIIMKRISDNLDVSFVLLELGAALNNLCIKSTENKDYFLNLKGIELMRTMIGRCERNVVYVSYEILRNCCVGSVSFKKAVRTDGILTLMLNELDNMKEDFVAKKRRNINKSSLYLYEE